jgi:hypothetical protein
MRILRMRFFLSEWLLILGTGSVEAETVVTRPFSGIVFITRTEKAPRPVALHLVLIDLTAPGIRFKVTPPGGRRDTIRQSTLDFLKREGAQVAVNGNFFLPFPSRDAEADVVGLAVSEGRMYSNFEPQPIISGDPGRFPDQRYAIVPLAPALNLDAENRAAVVHHDARYADHRHVREPVRLYNAVAGSAQIITEGRKTLPAYAPAGPLAKTKGFTDKHSWYDRPMARSCVGLTRDNKTLVLFTVDEAGGSGGMSLAEAADLLQRDYGVYNALNLDGGGSTTLALQDPTTGVGRIVNVSSDGPQGRLVGNNLAVFADPLPEHTPVKKSVLPRRPKHRKHRGCLAGYSLVPTLRRGNVCSTVGTLQPGPKPVPLFPRSGAGT